MPVECIDTLFLETYYQYQFGLLQENVDLMSQYLPLDCFKAIYVVDLCSSLCKEARKKAVAKGWKNVHVVEGDACLYTPPEEAATLVTFSYSLSSEPLDILVHCHSILLILLHHLQCLVSPLLQIQHTTVLINGIHRGRLSVNAAH